MAALCIIHLTPNCTQGCRVVYNSSSRLKFITFKGCLQEYQHNSSIAGLIGAIFMALTCATWLVTLQQICLLCANINSANLQSAIRYDIYVAFGSFTFTELRLCLNLLQQYMVNFSNMKKIYFTSFV